MLCSLTIYVIGLKFVGECVCGGRVVGQVRTQVCKFYVFYRLERVWHTDASQEDPWSGKRDRNLISNTPNYQKFCRTEELDWTFKLM